MGQIHLTQVLEKIWFRDLYLDLSDMAVRILMMDSVLRQSLQVPISEGLCSETFKHLHGSSFKWRRAVTVKKQPRRCMYVFIAALEQYDLRFQMNNPSLYLSTHSRSHTCSDLRASPLLSARVLAMTWTTAVPDKLLCSSYATEGLIHADVEYLPHRVTATLSWVA